VTGAVGVSCERNFCQSIFELFLFLLSALRRATPGFRLSFLGSCGSSLDNPTTSCVVFRLPPHQLWWFPHRFSRPILLASRLRVVVFEGWNSLGFASYALGGGRGARASRGEGNYDHDVSFWMHWQWERQGWRGDYGEELCAHRGRQRSAELCRW